MLSENEVSKLVFKYSEQLMLALSAVAWICANTTRLMRGVIDEDALVRPLDSGIVAHTALDVFTKEPPVPDNKLGLQKNVTVTSHLGASTVGTQEGVTIEIVEAVRACTFCSVCRKLGRLTMQLVASGTVQDLGTHAAPLMASRSWMCSDSAST